MLNNLAVLPNIPIRIHRKMLGFRVLVRNFHDICPYISVRIVCNIIAASSEPRAVGCHVTLAGGGDTVLDESLFYNGFLEAKDDSEGRTIVQVLRGTVTGF